MIDELLVEEINESISADDYIAESEVSFDIMEPAMIGFGLCGVVCMLSLGVSVIIGLIRRVM